MKLKEKMKRFWTLSRHHAEGFTLVELIVVIAILAILAGVAVPVYSTYIKQANMQADESLAVEIEQALLLAAYSGGLTVGDYVVVNYDADARFGNLSDNTITTADGAMAAAFGSEWAESLRLSYDGWDAGVAADATMMAFVSGSNFSSANMGTMLDQVQVVVNAAAGYFKGTGSVEEGSALADYLDNAGVSYDTIDDSNSNAIANALVFVVADNLSTINTNDSAAVSSFWAAWRRNNFDSLDWDVATRNAASYAMVYGAATYVDSVAGTTYCAQMQGDCNSILANRDTVLNKIKNENPTEWNAYRDGDTSSKMYQDAMAFLAYMQGVSTSADSLTGSTDLYSDSYFNDGTVLNYVTNYMSVSDVLTQTGAGKGAMVFVFNGTSIVCSTDFISQ